MKQILTEHKREINNNTIIVTNFNIPLSTMNKSSRQNINRETAALKSTIDQSDLRDIYRPFYPVATENTFFSSTGKQQKRL